MFPTVNYGRTIPVISSSCSHARDSPSCPSTRSAESSRNRDLCSPKFTDHVLPEVVDLNETEAVMRDALYIDTNELQRVDDRRILRYGLTLPLLQNIRYREQPLLVWTSGKASRACQVDATHLEAFHEAEAFWLDDRTTVNAWTMTAWVLESVDAVLPGRVVTLMPTTYPMCRQAWDVEVEQDGHWFELIAFGVFTDAIVRHVGGDPARHTAVGVGYGLERLAMMRYGIDDIRKVDVARVA